MQEGTVVGDMHIGLRRQQPTEARIHPGDAGDGVLARVTVELLVGAVTGDLEAAKVQRRADPDGAPGLTPSERGAGRANR